MTHREPFHAGEIAIQERTGERAVAVRHRDLIRETISSAARSFLSGQRTLALAGADDRDRPWAGLWLGEPGFAGSDDGQVVQLLRRRRFAAVGDPLDAIIVPGRAIGMLAIDLASRRRLRINGVVGGVSEERVEIVVREVFPNCPKYIQRREIRFRTRTDGVETARRGVIVGAELRQFIDGVDTVFVASRHSSRGADVSHRGGSPGFVRVAGERTLRFPDYPGNSMFQTLGNFESEARGGALLVDFERGRCLSVTGPVRVSYGSEDPGHPSGGTGRYWELDIEQWVDFHMGIAIEPCSVEMSPFNPSPLAQPVNETDS